MPLLFYRNARFRSVVHLSFQLGESLFAEEAKSAKPPVHKTSTHTPAAPLRLHDEETCRTLLAVAEAMVHEGKCAD